ncbi:hypothetical protein THAOC_22475, partial [Thalassiosira oceanica]
MNANEASPPPDPLRRVAVASPASTVPGQSGPIRIATLTTTLREGVDPFNALSMVVGTVIALLATGVIAALVYEEDTVDDTVVGEALPVGPDNESAGPSTQDDRAAVADDRSAAAARYLERLLDEGHERMDGDACTICYLYIGLPMDEHAMMK